MVIFIIQSLKEHKSLNTEKKLDTCFVYTVDLKQSIKSLIFHLLQVGDNAVKDIYFNFSQCMLCWYVCILTRKKVTQVKLRTASY